MYLFVEFDGGLVDICGRRLLLGNRMFDRADILGKHLDTQHN